MNPADTLYDPRFDSMERKKALAIAARWLQHVYGPEAYKAKGSLLDEVAHIYHKHGVIETEVK